VALLEITGGVIDPNGNMRAGPLLAKLAPQASARAGVC
jgi:hypothetical protein